MDLMYSTPSDDNIQEVQITKDVITKHAEPKITYKEDKAEKTSEATK